MIDILIPTYNRANCLIENIKSIEKLIEKENLAGSFSIIVSNNNSSDDTQERLEDIAKTITTKISIHNQTENIGLEKNAVYVLSKSTSKFVMYLGDDDYIPDGYLSYIVNKIATEPNLATIIPGFSALHVNGAITPARSESFDFKRYKPGYGTALKISSLGHQLSGLLLKREGLIENYTKYFELRNLYPFIYFVTHTSLTGVSIYAPKFQVLVSQDNSKDWKYDRSGLITDALKNYKIIYPTSVSKRVLLGIVFSAKQPWRLRIGKNPKHALDALLHIMTSDSIDPLYKLLIPFVYIVIYPAKVIRHLYRYKRPKALL